MLANALYLIFWCPSWCTLIQASVSCWECLCTMSDHRQSSMSTVCIPNSPKRILFKTPSTHNIGNVGGFGQIIGKYKKLKTNYREYRSQLKACILFTTICDRRVNISRYTGTFTNPFWTLFFSHAKDLAPSLQIQR